jgi:hypothetical protein
VRLVPPILLVGILLLPILTYAQGRYHDGPDRDGANYADHAAPMDTAGRVFRPSSVPRSGPSMTIANGIFAIRTLWGRCCIVTRPRSSKSHAMPKQLTARYGIIH